MENIITIDFKGDRLEALKDGRNNDYILLNVDTLTSSRYETLNDMFFELEGEDLENIELHTITSEELKAELDIIEPGEEDNFNYLYLREMI